ncbi:hypothetical protein LEP1GSC018_1197 [Leptospira kirschneri str. 2008720114]|nr:hypothetical protein LEP1GSC018_1197 [Leptospira kirschneri str. 2008720114]
MEFLNNSNFYHQSILWQNFPKILVISYIFSKNSYISKILL